MAKIPEDSSLEWARYEGPFDATHYEMVSQVGGRAEIMGRGLDGNLGRMTNPDGEWGHGIHLAGVRGGRVRRNWIRDVYGDGLVLSGTAPRDGDRITGSCVGVEIEQLVVSGARRNGVSFLGAERCTLRDATIHDVGHSHLPLPGGPLAGIDFEPDHEETPNIANEVRLTSISGCEGFGVVCDSGGDKTFGTRFVSCLVAASADGWAVLWRAGRTPGHEWHFWEDCLIAGPAAGLTNCHCRGVWFSSMPENKQSRRAIEIDHQEPVILDSCYVDGIRITPQLVREGHPAMYLSAPNLIVR